MEWNFQREEQQFEVVPEGKHRIRVRSAEKAVSSNGNDMLALQFDVSGSSQVLYHYIVFLPDKPQITNRNLTQFFDSFKDIALGDFTLSNWVGKVGACEVKHEEYNGSPTARIKYFISADKQSDLPPWTDANGKDPNAFIEVDSLEDLPF